MIKTTIVGIFALLLFLACSEKTEEKPADSSPHAPFSEFSGQKAFDHVANLTAFGPRPPESKGYEKSLQYIEKYLGSLGWKSKRSSFVAQTPAGIITFTNLMARYSPDGEPDWSVSPAYLVGGHLDSKRYTDKVFLGVNDSGSSTGVMLEMARVLGQNKEAANNVEFVFFDGEEAILENMVFQKDGLYGSTNYAVQLRKRKNKHSLGIIIDLVGDPRVDLLIGGDSDKDAVAQTQKAVETLNLQKAVRYYENSILDDHIPLMVYANMPVLHLIGEFEKMPYWHKEGDTLDKITPGALKNAGTLTLQVLQQLAN